MKWMPLLLSSGNSAAHFGGGIFNGGTLILGNSRVSNNEAGADGGGLYDLGALVLDDSTFDANTPNDCAGC